MATIAVPYNTYDYLNQATVWVPRPPRGPVAIADMDGEWRWNCAQLLLRNAARHADRYGWGAVITMTALGAPDDVVDWELREDEERLRDPQGWMRKTELYRALVAGLPRKQGKLLALADRARHYSECPSRVGGGDCSCDVGPAVEPEAVRAALVAIRAGAR